MPISKIQSDSRTQTMANNGGKRPFDLNARMAHICARSCHSIFERMVWVSTVSNLAKTLTQTPVVSIFQISPNN